MDWIVSSDPVCEDLVCELHNNGGEKVKVTLKPV